VVGAGTANTLLGLTAGTYTNAPIVGTDGDGADYLAFVAASKDLLQLTQLAFDPTQDYTFVLHRKIERNHNPLEALQSIYGVDIMRDNIQECRLRLLKLVSLFEPLTEDHIKVVWTNIAWINPEKYENGSLDYDFSFKPKFKQSDIDRWMEWVKNGRISEIELPVEEVNVPSQFIDIFSEN
jgi:hypothetical protein